MIILITKGSTRPITLERLYRLLRLDIPVYIDPSERISVVATYTKRDMNYRFYYIAGCHFHKRKNKRIVMLEVDTKSATP
jgi:hypothetical protein